MKVGWWVEMKAEKWVAAMVRYGAVWWVVRKVACRAAMKALSMAAKSAVMRVVGTAFC